MASQGNAPMNPFRTPAMIRAIAAIAVVTASTLFAGTTLAATRLKPFVLASAPNAANLAATVKAVEQSLSSHGFTVVGSEAPYTDARFGEHEQVSAVVIGVTSPALQAAAAQTPFGGYALVQRVSVTRIAGKAGTEIQVAYTNPEYMAAAYRLKSDLADVRAALGKALGAKEDFGSRHGLSVSDLRGYHYKIFMPYFTDMHTLARYKSHREAMAAVEAGLATHAGGASKAWQVSVPGKPETLFGVALAGTPHNACSGDAYIMSRIDFAPVKSTPHLPYDILVSGSKVYALAVKFRIAINFPDLSMMGSHSFMSIMCAPDAIVKALKAVARTQPTAAPAAAGTASAVPVVPAAPASAAPAPASTHAG